MSREASHTSTHSTSASAMSPAARQLLNFLQEPADKPQARTGDMVDIPDTADSAYWAYEQLRNAVEYQEQHLLMRNAIGRFLTRSFASAERSSRTSLGYEVVRELTKARYLANNTVSSGTVEQLNLRLQRYQELYESALPSFAQNQQRLFELVVGIASADLQHLLLPNRVQDGIINFTYHSFQAFIESPEKLEQHDLVALYAAVHRALLRSDNQTIHHYMLENQFPGWHESERHVRQIAVRLKDFADNVEYATQGKRARVIGKLVRNRIAPYVILLHTLQQSPHPEDLLERPDKLSSRTGLIAEEQYSKARGRLRAGIVRAIIFVLITKTLLALALEVPYELYVLGELHWLPLTANLLFPPLYMLLIGLTIKTPDHRNTDQIVRDLQSIIYRQGTPLRYPLGRRFDKSASVAFNIIYVICSLGVITVLALLLRQFGFNIVSALIFFVFLSTVSFFGYRISQSVRELIVVQKRNVFDTLWSVVVTPFIALGQWFSDRYSRFNIFMLILDFIIEAPYKTLLRFYEQWAAFLREKQDDVLK